MPVHQCKRCLYIAPTKTILRQHLFRVNACQIAEGGREISITDLVEELGQPRERGTRGNEVCRYCNSMFSFKSGLLRHMKSCKVKEEESRSDLVQEIENLKKELQSIRNITATPGFPISSSTSTSIPNTQKTKTYEAKA